MAQIRVLIRLSDYKDGEDHLTKSDLLVLLEMLQDSQQNEECQKMVAAGNLVFGKDIITELIEHINPLKKQLLQYVRDMRNTIKV